jgi:hypothetical protein
MKRRVRLATHMYSTSLKTDLSDLTGPFRGSLPTRAVPSCGGTPDAIRTTRQRGEDRSSGMSHLVLHQMGADRPEALATGAAGTVYLSHPLLVHAAQLNRGTTPRFMAQPPLHPAEPFRLEREDGSYSPVEIAIRQALQKGRA